MGQWIASLQSLRWDMAGQIVLAALLGAIVGLEREWTGHAAGLRTTMLVTVGSCLFTMLSIDGFPVKGTSQDTARVAAQIVSGIGFRGAGALFQTKSHVKGLTTAATIWLVAAIGMGVGSGMYFIATFTTLLTEVVLVILKPIGDRLNERKRRAARNGGKQPLGVGQRTPADDYEAPYHDEDED